MKLAALTALVALPACESYLGVTGFIEDGKGNRLPQVSVTVLEGDKLHPEEGGVTGITGCFHFGHLNDRDPPDVRVTMMRAGFKPAEITQPARYERYYRIVLAGEAEAAPSRVEQVPAELGEQLWVACQGADAGRP